MVEGAVEDALAIGEPGGGPCERGDFAHRLGTIEGDGGAVCRDGIERGRAADDGGRVEGVPREEEGRRRHVGLDDGRPRSKIEAIEMGVLVVEEQPSVLREHELGERAPVRIGGVDALFPVVEIEGTAVGNGDGLPVHGGVGGILQRKIFFIAARKEQRRFGNGRGRKASLDGKDPPQKCSGESRPQPEDGFRASIHRTIITRARVKDKEIPQKKGSVGKKRSSFFMPNAAVREGIRPSQKKFFQNAKKFGILAPGCHISVLS